MEQLIILFFVGLGSSFISGVCGMAGGVTLLASLTLIMPFNVIVPIHGAAQLVSNLSRTYYLRNDVNAWVMKMFFLSTPFGAAGAYLFIKSLPSLDFAYVIIAFFLFFVALRPRHIPELRLGRFGFAVLGLVAGFLGCIIGATGPLLAPFFVRSDFSKEEIVATKAASQIFIHLMKVPVFIGLAFPYQDHAKTIIALFIGVLLGTKIGIWALGKMNWQHFDCIVRVVMLLIGIKLVLEWYGIAL